MLRLGFKGSLLASTIIAVSHAGPAYAQDDTAVPDAAAESDAAAQETATADADIVVTGTLIRNPNLVSSSPVASVGAEEIALNQTNTAEEVLRELPGAVPSIGNAVNNGNGGAAYVDLRGLGNFRNLVLLDGVRITPSSTIGRVDLNNVPLALVERVDTLTGGAATTYGADAVSGVVNFITRRDFAGFELNASEQITGKGDGNVMRVDATVGASFDDGRGNAVLSLGYQEADPVYQGARRFSLTNYTSTSGATGGSGTTVPARFSRPGLGQNTIVPTTGFTRPYVAATDAFNFNPYNIFQTPFERFNIFGAAHYEIADNIEVYTRGMFSKNTVSTIIAPSGSFGSLALIPVSSPFLPAGARSQFCASNDFDFNTAGVQTLTPAQCAAAALATSPNDPNFRAFQTTIGRRTVEVGPRLADFVTQYFDYRAGLRINLTDNLDLHIAGSYGESENRSTLRNYVLTSRLRTALYTTSATTCNLGAPPAVPNPNPLLPPLAAAGAAPSAGTGCVPVNIFGAAGSITPAMIPYLTANATVGQVATLSQARALLNGDFGASAPWANDPIGFALGGEFRKYAAAQQADALSQTSGELGGAGGAVTNFNGAYNVYEAYGEIIAPLVQDRPFFNELTLEAGLRYSSYTLDTPGEPSFNTTTWKLAATWAPIDALKFRANFQRAVRAPNIAELFAPQVVGLTSLATDPCRTTATYPGPAANANLRAVCLLQGAPASTIGNIINPTAGQAAGTFSGGTYLRPEKANSWTIGLVFQPDFVPGLSLTVDYYNIKITEAISQPTALDLVRNCFGDVNASGVTAATVSNPLCQLFRRNPVTGGLDGDPATTGGLVFFPSNAGIIKTDGIDFGLNYRRNLGFAKLALSFQGNWTNRSSFQSFDGNSVVPPGYPGAGLPVLATAPIECVGLYSTNCGSPGSSGPSSVQGSLQPEFTWNQRTTLTFGDLDVSLLWRHISEMNAEPGVTAFSGTLAAGTLAGRQVNFGHIPAFNYFDLSLRFGIDEHLDITMSVQNLLDKDPPLTGSTIGTTAYNSGNTYPSTYDSLGRRFAVGARLRF
jgi:outer membrane receptor protein involved in Fe transport